MFQNIKNKKIQYLLKKIHINGFFGGIIFSFSGLVQATLISATISTGQGEARIIDLSNNVSGITQPEIGVDTQPVAGSAEPIACPRTGDLLCVLYSPNASFSGLDTFIISVINDEDEFETATITVNVNQVVVSNNGAVPDEAVKGALSEICNNDQSSDVDELCQRFNTFNIVNATAGEVPEDLRELIDALTPQDVAAQSTTGSVLASQQLENIGKHLAALRRGHENTTFSGLSFRYNGGNIPVTRLFSNSPKANEGIAQSIFGTRWGWFVNGSLGGGSQDETIFENGFDLDSDGLSLGADYRIGNSGVIGSAIGFGNTKLEFSRDQGGLDTKGVSVILFGSFYLSDNAYIDFIGSINRNEFEATRRIVFGDTDSFAESVNQSQATAISIAGGMEVWHFKGLTTTLNASADYVKSDIEGYSETGSSPFNVTVAERITEKVSVSAGGSFTYAVSLSRAVLLPQFDLNLVHQFKQGNELVEGYFSGDPDKTQFQFETNSPDENYVRVKLGVSAVFTKGHSAFIQFGSTLFQNDNQNWNSTVGYRAEM